MGYEAFRVRRQFGFRGWEFAPNPGASCKCDCRSDGLHCEGSVASTCVCKATTCRCACGIAKERYAGDIMLIEERHSRKEILLENRFLIGDGALPSVEELLQNPDVARQIELWKPSRRRAKTSA